LGHPVFNMGPYKITKSWFAWRTGWR